MNTITAIQLPIEWSIFGWPETPLLGEIALTTGDPGWAWKPQTPAFEIPLIETPHATRVPGFTLDHVVLLVPDIDAATDTFKEVEGEPRLRMRVRERDVAFYRCGTVIEVIESPIRRASIYGIAVRTESSLESLALEWKSRGLSIGDIKDAIQPRRRIMTVHGLDAGFAVMSGDRDLKTK